MNIQFTYEPDAANNIQLHQALNKAASIFNLAITNPETVNIQVGNGDINGNPITLGDLSESSPNLSTLNFNQTIVDLASDGNPTPPIYNIPFNSKEQLPDTLPITTAQLKAFGSISSTAPGVDGYMGFATTYKLTFSHNSVPASYDLVGAAEQEISHVLGRTAGYGPQMLTQYSAPGALSGPAGGGYFSLDGGTTSLGTFSTAGDNADWAAIGDGDAFDNMLSPGMKQAVSPLDWQLMVANGYNIRATTPQEQDIARLYVAAFNRTADPSGCTAWTNALTGGALTLTQIANAFAQSPEFLTDYSSATNSAYVADIYANSLGRAPEAAGLAAWTAALNAGASRGAVLAAISDSQEAITLGKGMS